FSDAGHVAYPTLPARCCRCACRQFGFIQLRPCTNGCRNYKPCQQSTLPKKYISRYILLVSRLDKSYQASSSTCLKG
ncbi:unnamed protein product, partial [Musa textilis]